MVTGCTDGIGKEFAKLLAQKGICICGKFFFVLFIPFCVRLLAFVVYFCIPPISRLLLSAVALLVQSLHDKIGSKDLFLTSKFSDFDVKLFLLTVLNLILAPCPQRFGSA